jgi:hypothetical protein
MRRAPLVQEPLDERALAVRHDPQPLSSGHFFLHTSQGGGAQVLRLLAAR